MPDRECPRAPERRGHIGPLTFPRISARPAHLPDHSPLQPTAGELVPPAVQYSGAEAALSAAASPSPLQVCAQWVLAARWPEQPRAAALRSARMGPQRAPEESSSASATCGLRQRDRLFRVVRRQPVASQGPMAQLAERERLPVLACWPGRQAAQPGQQASRAQAQAPGHP